MKIPYSMFSLDIGCHYGWLMKDIFVAKKSSHHVKHHRCFSYCWYLVVNDKRSQLFLIWSELFGHKEHRLRQCQHPLDLVWLQPTMFFGLLYRLREQVWSLQMLRNLYSPGSQPIWLNSGSRYKSRSFLEFVAQYQSADRQQVFWLFQEDRPTSN